MVIRRPWGACWMVAEGGEGENLLPFSKGGWGGVGGVSRLRFPPGPHLRSSRFSRHPRLRQAPTRRFAKNRNLGGFWPQAPGGPGPKPPGDLAHRPLGPGSRHSHRLTSCKPILLLRLKPKGPIRSPWGALDCFRRRSFTGFPSSLQHFSR